MMTFCQHQEGCFKMATRCFDYCSHHYKQELRTNRLLCLFAAAEVATEVRAARDRRIRRERQQQGNAMRDLLMFRRTFDLLDAGDCLAPLLEATREEDPALAHAVGPFLDILFASLHTLRDELDLIAVGGARRDEARIRLTAAILRPTPFHTYYALARTIQRTGVGFRHARLPQDGIRALLVAANQLEQVLLRVVGLRDGPVAIRGSGLVSAPGPVPVPVPTLARFVADRENVHTPISVGLMTHVTAILNRRWAEPLPCAETWAVSHLTIRFLAIHCGTILQLSEDLETRPPYRTLFAQVASEIWSREEHYGVIGPVQKELFQRLFEELTDGLDLCLQGKLSRLCSVLQGFDEEVDALVCRTREDFQNAIAAIAASAASAEEAAAELETLFVDYASIVPASEHAAWRAAVLDR